MKCLFSGLVFLLAFEWCHAQDDVMRMVYQETVCEPEWHDYQNPQNTLKNIQNLFDKDSVKILKMTWTGTPYEVTCAECACLTGRNIEITIYKKDREKAEAMHFYPPWVWMEKNELVCEWTDSLNENRIQEGLFEKNIHARLISITGPSQKPPRDYGKSSGRILTIKVNQEDSERAKKYGFILKTDFKEY